MVYSFWCQLGIEHLFIYHRPVAVNGWHSWVVRFNPIGVVIRFTAKQVHVTALLVAGQSLHTMDVAPFA